MARVKGALNARKKHKNLNTFDGIRTRNPWIKSPKL